MTFDPLLGGRNYDIPDLNQQQEMLKQKWAELQQTMQTTTLRQVAPSQNTPVWDEIDNLARDFSDVEMQSLTQNEEFMESSSTIQNILQREIARMMRPYVESTKDGKEALEKHLILLKRLHKETKEKTNYNESLMNEYMMNFSDKTWNEFIEIKKGTTKKK